jgi:hypothetical protein
VACHRIIIPKLVLLKGGVVGGLLALVYPYCMRCDTSFTILAGLVGMLIGGSIQAIRLLSGNKDNGNKQTWYSFYRDTLVIYPFVCLLFMFVPGIIVNSRLNNGIFASLEQGLRDQIHQMQMEVTYIVLLLGLACFYIGQLQGMINIMRRDPQNNTGGQQLAGFDVR